MRGQRRSPCSPRQQAGRDGWHTRPGWWQQRAAANAALAMREFLARTAQRENTGAGTPDELLVTLSAGLAAVLDTHHPDEHGICPACSRLPAPWRWVVRVRWPCPLLRTLTRELDHVTEAHR
ncbi:MAG TPA: hypothetical protein VIS06_12490 [Mycobacteriales bacterium]